MSKRLASFVPAIKPFQLFTGTALIAALWLEKSQSWPVGIVVMVTAIFYPWCFLTARPRASEQSLQSPQSPQSMDRDFADRDFALNLAGLTYLTGIMIAVKPFPGIAAVMIGMLVYERIWSAHQSRSHEIPVPMLPDFLRVVRDSSKALMSPRRFFINGWLMGFDKRTILFMFTTAAGCIAVLAH